jgi:hypothetical protein
MHFPSTPFNRSQNMFTAWLYIALALPISAIFSVLWAYLNEPLMRRRRAITLGLTLILSAGISFYLLGFMPSFVSYLIRKEYPADMIKHYEQATTVILWLLPFVTAALGTNLISDALTREVRYGKPPNHHDRRMKLLTTLVRNEVAARTEMVRKRRSTRLGQQALRAAASRDKPRPPRHLSRRQLLPIQNS